MKRLLLMLFMFVLGAISVLRYQKYNQYAVEEDTYTDRVKNLVEGVSKDYDHLKLKTADKVKTTVDSLATSADKSREVVHGWLGNNDIEPSSTVDDWELKTDFDQ